jgi:drug/metabolite transporter (DMT)-like permease
VTPRQSALLGCVALIWGSSYLLIKYSLEAFSPAEVVFLRGALAALVLLPLCYLRGGAARAALGIGPRHPGRVLAIGVLFVAAPFLLISYGERVVPVGLTAVLISPAPIFIAAFAPLLDPSERLRRAQWAGLGVGLGGIALLVGVESIGTLDQFLGAMAMIGAAACYAGASYLVKRQWAGVPSLATSAWAVTAGAIIVLPVAILTAHGGTPGGRAIWTTIVLGPVNTGLAFVIYYGLIGEIGAGRAALVTYLTPPFSLAFGLIFKDERITLAVLAGLTLILAGVALASRTAGAVAATAAVSPSGTSPPAP